MADSAYSSNVHTVHKMQTFHKIVNSSLDFLRQTKWISVLIGRFRKEIATKHSKKEIILLDVFFKFLLSTLDII